MRIGDKIQGIVTGIQPYGAFVQLENGTIGLIHISEIKTGFVDNIHHYLTIGQEIIVQVVDVDEYSKKASLSMRTLEREQPKAPAHRRFTNGRTRAGFTPLAKSLPKWIKEAKQYLEEQKETQKER
ncbi:S1 RNA-binding domain-containing protein [Streptococcus suis]|nr:S1 RNA-binding domain-containing protein [Streptococcus suis]